MITEPLFKNNILSNIYNNFAYWLSFDNLYIGIAIISLIMSINLVMVKIWFNVGTYRSFTEESNECFELKKHWKGMATLFLSFAVYCITVFTLEMSIFNNFDSMTINYIDSMQEGIKPIFDGVRFTPFQGIDLNIIFGISNNYLLLSCYVVFKRALCLYLIYKIFAFISVNKRLVMISIINVVPSFFEINNIIFPELNLVIFLLLSLLFLNLYQIKRNILYLLLFIVFMNLGIYTKENLIIFYAGYLLYFFLDAVIEEKITITSFYHPLKTIKLFPVEYVMLWSMLIYFTCWYMLKPISGDSIYIQVHESNFMDIIKVYLFDILLLLCAIVVFMIKIIKDNVYSLRLLSEGSLLGCCLLTFVIVFYLRISNYNLSYYVCISSIFSIIYIYSQISRKSVLIVFSLLMLVISGCKDYYLIKHHEGRDTRAVGQFMINMSDCGEQISIYLHYSSDDSSKWWKTMAWSSALKYAYPNANLVLKTDLDVYRYYEREENKFFEKRLGVPEAGDYLLIEKLNDPDYVPSLPYEIAYENSTYRLYLLRE